MEANKHTSQPAEKSVNQMASKAAWYAENHIKVFPCNPEKKPLVKWKERATSEIEQIKSWWTEHPSAMIGLPCGSVNGVIVLDIDVKNGQDGFKNLAMKGHEIPPGAFEVKTPSGGSHFYFTLREGELVRNSASTIAKGVDVRGEGGYVIAPPSICPTGRYEPTTESTAKRFLELFR